MYHHAESRIFINMLKVIVLNVINLQVVKFYWINFLSSIELEGGQNIFFFLTIKLEFSNGLENIL
jgi:hypothetical protein